MGEYNLITLKQTAKNLSIPIKYKDGKKTLIYKKTELYDKVMEYLIKNK